MYSYILSGAVRGINSYLVQVEVDISPGLPGFDMVGFLGSEVKEARERVRVALKNVGILMPPTRVTVNLSPANIRKEGTAFDLPVAVGILQAMELLPQDSLRDTLIIGELGLNGQLRPVRGILPIVMEARKRGLKRCIVPGANAREGAIVEDMEVYGMEHLQQVIDFLNLPEEKRADRFQKTETDLQKLFERRDDSLPDFSDIRGQESVRRAAQIAAAGFHHMLMAGPPGSGKTMIAKRIPSILPSMNMEEALEVSTIYSVAGQLREESPLITERPFLNPHHTITETALAGGGHVPRPGVLSLSHRGVLFLDEMTEFSKSVLEILRQPIEDREIMISRGTGTFRYPASCLVIGALNPCPCGYYPDRNRCTCSLPQVERYLRKISGPVLDRMDLLVQVKKVDVKKLGREEIGESSARMREAIERARSIQEIRYVGSRYLFNADLDAAGIARFCRLEEPEKTHMEQLFEVLGLSARSYHKVLKVARTIADLEGSEKITTEHLSEAAQYRTADALFRGGAAS